MSQARDRQIEIIKQRLLRQSTPRLQVSLLLFDHGLGGLSHFILAFTSRRYSDVGSLSGSDIDFICCVLVNAAYLAMVPRP